MDLGLLGGLSEGLKQGLQSYQEQSRYNTERQEKQKALQRQALMDKLAMQQAGYSQGDSGNLIETPEHQKQRQIDQLTHQAGLLKSGFKIGTDESGQPALEKVSGFRDLEDEYKKAQIESLKAEAQKKRQEKPGKTISSTEAQSIGGAKSAVKELEDYNELLKSAEDISGKGLNRFGASAMGLLQVGETGKRAASVDAAGSKVAQVLGKYLEGGKLTDSDYKRYLDMLPSRSDTPVVRDNKVKILQRLVSQRHNEELESFGQAGYDVSNIKKMETGSAVSLPKGGLIDQTKKIPSFEEFMNSRR